MAKYIAKDSLIGLKEFRDNTEQVIAAVKKGKKFTVLRHSKPVFAIVPAEEGARSPRPSLWTTLM